MAKLYSIILTLAIVNVCLSQNFPSGKYVLNLTEGIFKSHFKKKMKYTSVIVYKGHKPFGKVGSGEKEKYIYNVEKMSIYCSNGDTIPVINGELMLYFDRYKYKKVGWLKYWFPRLLKEEQFRW